MAELMEAAKAACVTMQRTDYWNAVHARSNPYAREFFQNEARKSSALTRRLLFAIIDNRKTISSDENIFILPTGYRHTSETTATKLHVEGNTP